MFLFSSAYSSLWVWLLVLLSISGLSRIEPFDAITNGTENFNEVSKPVIRFIASDNRGDSHQEPVKSLFRERRPRLTSNNSVENTIIIRIQICGNLEFLKQREWCRVLKRTFLENSCVKNKNRKTIKAPIYFAVCVWPFWPTEHFLRDREVEKLWLFSEEGNLLQVWSDFLSYHLRQSFNNASRIENSTSRSCP